MNKPILIATLCLLPFMTHAKDPWEKTDKHAPSGQFDFNVYALTWQPTFYRKNNRGSRENHFSVHGIWPYFNLPDIDEVRNYHPSYCYDSPGCLDRTDCQLTEGELRKILNNEQIQALYPFEERLFQHEWHKHGTCSGLKPAEFFLQAKTHENTVFSGLTALLKMIGAHSTDFVIEVSTLKALLPENTGLRCTAVDGQNMLFEVFYFMDLSGKFHETDTQIGGECDEQVLIPIDAGSQRYDN
ncbi:MAG: ribonuclease T2 family protein [Endozoicomonas sp.]